MRIISFTTKFEAGPYAKVLANLDKALLSDWILKQLEQSTEEVKEEEDLNNTYD